MKITVHTDGRLDAALEETGKSRSQLQKLIKAGHVMVNDEVVTKPSFAVHEGDEITISSFDSTRDDAVDIEPIEQQLPVIYEDESCLVINKPAGISVHPGHAMDPGQSTLLNGIAHLFAERSLPFSAEGVLVHRLDKDTTGCLLVAKTMEAHSILQQQFADRTVQKFYYALVAGVPEPRSALIDAPIGRNATDRTKMSVLKTSNSRAAQTTYEIVEDNGSVALVRCQLHTGRTHQVRVHLSSIGHPILGDATYSTSQSAALSTEYDVTLLCLHAWQLTFTSPADQQAHIVCADFSSHLSQNIESCGFQAPSS